MRSLRILLMMVLLILLVPLVSLAQQAPAAEPSCETELSFYRKYTGIVTVERDRGLQQMERMNLQIAYLKQRIAQLEKAKTEKPEK